MYPAHNKPSATNALGWESFQSLEQFFYSGQEKKIKKIHLTQWISFSHYVKRKVSDVCIDSLIKPVFIKNNFSI